MKCLAILMLMSSLLASEAQELPQEESHVEPRCAKDGKHGQKGKRGQDGKEGESGKSGWFKGGDGGNGGDAE